jgi:hypothetical protein
MRPPSSSCQGEEQGLGRSLLDRTIQDAANDHGSAVFLLITAIHGEERRQMLTTAKAVAQRWPILRTIYGHARNAYTSYLKSRNPSQDIFRDKFVRNAWRSQESVSGTGSAMTQTRLIVEELPRVLRSLGATSLLDIPCGDFNWMQRVDLEGIDYLGADVVGELIEANRRFARPGIRFRQMNLLTDRLPTVDAIFCRDCLVHLSIADVHRALANIRRSGSTWLVTTTFPDHRENVDIPTGRWRVLNMERPPFSFPRPDRMIVEGCTEGDGKYRDKALGVWRIADLVRT